MKMLAFAFLSFTLVTVAHASAEAACGSFEVSKGDVKVQSGAKVSAAAVGSKICSGDTVIAADQSRAKIKMEDGNELNISPNSKIVLENYQYDAAANKKKVLLNVLKGKVRATTREENMYNDKAKDGQANTFQVKTKSAVAGVRGTDFLTGFDPSTSKTEVITFRGKVEVGLPGAGGTIMRAVQVGVGQSTVVNMGQAPAVPKVVPAVEFKQMDSETSASGSQTGASNSGSDSGRRPASGGSMATSNETSGDVKHGDAAPRSPSSTTSSPTVVVPPKTTTVVPPVLPTQVVNQVLNKALLKITIGVDR